ncbi:MAG: helix-turn-helix domain-containing protein [Ramlibacter sp.]|nr:helix-turn-helix domain-containing protein [Ramlibacter sp.]
MSNIGTVLKSEMSRVARKELRGETQALKKSISQYRTQIADLKRRMQALEQQIKRVGKVAGKAAPAAAAGKADGASNLRFSAKGFGAQRKRLGLSAAALAKILGVSQLSVYKWESGKARPRAKQLESIASLRGMGKREAAARLSAEEPAASE